MVAFSWLVPLLVVVSESTQVALMVVKVTHFGPVCLAVAVAQFRFLLLYRLAAQSALCRLEALPFEARVLFLITLEVQGILVVELIANPILRQLLIEKLIIQDIILLVRVPHFGRRFLLNLNRNRIGTIINLWCLFFLVELGNALEEVRP